MILRIELLLVLVSSALSEQTCSWAAGGRHQDECAETPVPAGVRLTGSEAGWKDMPLLGYGTCCRPSAKGEPLVNSTLAYLAAGGRHIDTAQMYENHEDLARAIRLSGVDREDLWVTSKLNTWGEPPESAPVNDRATAVAAVRSSLRELGLEYLDLMLIHGVWGLSVERRSEIWSGLVEAQEAGLVRHIGVSNFNRKQIEELEEATGRRPSVNQLEYHPWIGSEARALVRWCQDRGIVVTAYGSLGGSANRAKSEAVAAVAALRGMAPAAVFLRWALDQGCVVIPGATSKAHIVANLAVGDSKHALTAADRAQIEGAERPAAFMDWQNIDEY